MKLSSFIVSKNMKLKQLSILFACVLSGTADVVIADALTYSPDQWPRHWNVLMNETQTQNFNGCCQQNAGHYSIQNYQSEQPARSPMWGMMPEVKQKNRRSVRPEYNTNFHLMNYSNPGNNYSSFNPNMYSYGWNNYGFNNVYSTPYLQPYSLPVLAPGLAAPGLPLGVNPYLMNPYSGGYAPFGMTPGIGTFW